MHFAMCLLSFVHMILVFFKFVLSLILFGACMQVDHCWHYACASSSDETMVSRFV
jgi:hypothetical protein